MRNPIKPKTSIYTPKVAEPGRVHFVLQREAYQKQRPKPPMEWIQDTPCEFIFFMQLGQ